MLKHVTALGAALCSLSLTSFAQTQPSQPSLSAKDMVTRAEQRYKGDNMVSIMAMTLTSAEGNVRHRGLLWYRTEADGVSKDLQKFYYPQNIRDVATLKEEVKDRDDRQYLYLPAAKKMRRVSAKNQSWVGSDLTYEDLQEIKIEDWTYRFIGSKTVDGFETSLVEMTPKPGSDSVYSKRINFIRNDGSFYPARVEFFDRDGKLLKELVNRDVKNVQGALYSNVLTVHNVQDNHKTELERLWIRVNTNVPASIMTSRQMEKPIETFDRPADIGSLLRDAFSKREARGGFSE